MKLHSVKIADRALADMNAIYDYLAMQLQVPDTAIRQYNRIAAAIESLHSLPERYPLLDVQPEHDLGMRRMLVDNNSVIYVVEEEAATVLRVLYAPSDFIARLGSES